MTNKYISFSQLKNWVKCPFYHKLASIDKVEGSFSGNIYTAFGSALHETIEKHLENEIKDPSLLKCIKNQKLISNQFLINK